MPSKKREQPDRSEVWTRVNDEGQRVYIGVQISDGRVVAATNAYETAEDARTGMRLYGGQAAWADQHRDTFEVVP